jgi:RNA polymerase sigma factor (TIGR02999 family)
MTGARGEVEALLRRWAAGDDHARDLVFPLVYDELRVLARGYLRRERRDHTLQPTALVHEAFLHFADGGPVPVDCRGRFMALMAQAMRHVLVDHARARRAAKRGGGATRVTFDEAPDDRVASPVDVLALDEVLHRLAALDPRQAEVVELRAFGGFEVREVAEALGVSEATVKREWAIAKAWLHRELR